MTKTAEQVITIKLPDVWKVRHADEYAKGKAEYDEKHPKSTGVLTSFYGGLALWKAGFVQIEGPQEFIDLLNSPRPDDIPMSVIGLINREIVGSLLAAQDAPLAWGVKVSSNGSSVAS